VRLPLVNSASDAKAVAPVKPGAGTERILIVGDNTDSADAMAMLMGTYGYVCTAYTFESALGEAASFAPHVALLGSSLLLIWMYFLC
jgi:two-component system CheB/CheR fusion protein